MAKIRVNEIEYNVPFFADMGRDGVMLVLQLSFVQVATLFMASPTFTYVNVDDETEYNGYALTYMVQQGNSVRIKLDKGELING